MSNKKVVLALTKFFFLFKHYFPSVFHFMLYALRVFPIFLEFQYPTVNIFMFYLKRIKTYFKS